MTQSTSFFRTTWFFKFCECLLAAIAICNVLMISLELLPASFWQQYPSAGEYIMTGTIAVAALSALVLFQINLHTYLVDSPGLPEHTIG